MAAAYVRTYGFTHACTCPRAFELRPRRKKLRMLCQSSCHCCRLCQLSRVCQLYQAACAPYVRVRTYVRTHVFQYARRYVRTYVVHKDVCCVRVVRGRANTCVTYVRTYAVRTAVSCVPVVQGHASAYVRTYVRTDFSNPRNERAYVRTYVCQLS